jgi:hypothetical protein
MRTQRGIALVAALLVMAAVMALGVGSMFLTEMNLRIAENARSNAIAKNHADAGIDTAIVLLLKLHGDNKEFPSSFTLPVTTNQSYAMLPGTEGYLRDGPNRVRVAVEGFTLTADAPNNARYVAEVLLGMNEGDELPNFPPGLISQGQTRVNGTVNFTGDGSGMPRLHGNTGFYLDNSGFYWSCEEGKAPPNCTRFTGSDAPVTAATGQSSYTCWAKDSTSYTGVCSGNTPTANHLTEPVNMGAPPYEELRNEHFNSPGTSATTPPCSHTVDSSTFARSDYVLPTGVTTLCVTGGEVKLTNSRTYSDINIIIFGTALFESNMTLTNVNLLVAKTSATSTSTGTLHNKGNITLNGSRLFSDNNMLLEGNVNSTGSSTIASGGDITVKGNAIQPSNPGEEVGLSIFAKKNVLIDGNMEKGGSGPVNVNLWAGGTTTVTGNLNIRGGLYSVGTLQVNGNVWVDSRADLINEDLPIIAVVSVISRR